jgi:hypothetical protein
MLTRRRDGGPDGRVVVIAAAERTDGVPVVEEGWAGIPETSPKSGEPYSLAVLGEFEIAFITSSKVGDTIYIETTAFHLARAEPASKNATGAATKPEIESKKTTIAFAKVTAVPASGQFPAGMSSNIASSPPTGKMWVKLLEQQP